MELYVHSPIHYFRYGTTFVLFSHLIGPPVYQSFPFTRRIGLCKNGVCDFRVPVMTAVCCTFTPRDAVNVSLFRPEGFMICNVSSRGCNYARESVSKMRSAFHLNCCARQRSAISRRNMRIHCATSRNIAGSIPDEVIGFFQLT
jgi:hypothetical protein